MPNPRENPGANPPSTPATGTPQPPRAPRRTPGEPPAPTPAPPPATEPAEPQRARKLALSTAFFSAATGLSRVAGLVREIVAANYFGVTGAMSAFTIAFQVPNLVRA